MKHTFYAAVLAAALLGFCNSSLHAADAAPAQAATNLLGGEAAARQATDTVPEVAALILAGTGLILISRRARRRHRFGQH